MIILIWYSIDNSWYIFEVYKILKLELGDLSGDQAATGAVQRKFEKF